MLELEDGDGFISAFHEMKQLQGAVSGSPPLVSVRIPFDADRALDLTLQGAQVLHLVSDRSGKRRWAT